MLRWMTPVSIVETGLDCIGVIVGFILAARLGFGEDFVAREEEIRWVDFGGNRTGGDDMTGRIGWDDATVSTLPERPRFSE